MLADAGSDDDDMPPLSDNSNYQDDFSDTEDEEEEEEEERISIPNPCAPSGLQAPSPTPVSALAGSTACTEMRHLASQTPRK